MHPSPASRFCERSKQVGLLAIDSAGDNAIAKKNFTVGGQFGGGGGTGGGGGAGGNQGPVIPSGLIVTGPTGGVARIEGITDPENDPVERVEWTIDPEGANAQPGSGLVINLRNVPPGEYGLAIIATDDRGASTTGRATLQVTAGAGAVLRAPPPPAGEPTGPALRLPSLTLSQGATVVLDAGATGIPPKSRGDFTYSWALFQKASGNRVDSTDQPVARFNLTTADTFQLQFRATDKKTGAVSTATSNVRATARPPALPPLPKVVKGSTCGPFTAGTNADTKLSCPNLQVVDGNPPAPYTQTTFAWRVTNINTGSVKTGIGREFDAGRWAPRGVGTAWGRRGGRARAAGAGVESSRESARPCACVRLGNRHAPLAGSRRAPPLQQLPGSGLPAKPSLPYSPARRQADRRRLCGGAGRGRVQPVAQVGEHSHLPLHNPHGEPPAPRAARPPAARPRGRWHAAAPRARRRRRCVP